MYSAADMLTSILEFRASNPDATLQQLQAFARDRMQGQADEFDINFGQAAEIDRHLFGFSHGKLWSFAYNSPGEGDTIMLPDGQTATAYDCGVFTFKFH